VKEGKHLGDVKTDGWVILKWMVKEQDKRMRTLNQEGRR
jgi:hypothetical protein